MIYLKINNLKVLVNANLSVLEACSFVGIYIPRFCFHESLSIAGNCRLCLVEIKNLIKPVASCALPVSQNMIIYTNSPSVKKARENIIEFLLLNHPLDCPICDQGGECDLQDQTFIFGNDSSRYYKTKKVVEDKIMGNFIKTIMTRCIHCTRCIRFSDEVIGNFSLGMLNRGQQSEIGFYSNYKSYNSEISGNIIDLCPVGALTSKTYAFKSRPWELKCQETVDFTDSLTTEILVDIKESEILRIQPKPIKNLFISDKIRFSFDSNKKNRIHNIYYKSNKKYKIVNLSELHFYINVIKNKKVTFLVNDNIDLTLLNYLKNFTNRRLNSKICALSNYIECNKIHNSNIINTITDLDKNSKFCLLFSTNLKIENTLLNMKLRIKYNKLNLKFYSFGLYFKSNIFPFFLNINIDLLVNFFEGKLPINKNFLKNINNIFIIGSNFKKSIKYTNLFYIIKKISPTSIIIQNELKPNSVGLKFLGVSSLNKKIVKNTDFFICFYNEDNIKNRKILKKKNFLWFNSHGSYLAFKALIVLPFSSPFESENIFLNMNYDIKKTKQLFKNQINGEIISKFFNLLFNNNTYKIHNRHLFFIFELLNKVTKINTNKRFLNIFNIAYSIINKKPLKSVLEDFYLDNVFTKNSFFLIKQSQDQRKNYFFDKI